MSVIPGWWVLSFTGFTWLPAATVLGWCWISDLCAISTEESGKTQYALIKIINKQHFSIMYLKQCQMGLSYTSVNSSLSATTPYSSTAAAFRSTYSMFVPPPSQKDKLFLETICVITSNGSPILGKASTASELPFRSSRNADSNPRTDGWYDRNPLSRLESFHRCMTNTSTRGFGHRTASFKKCPSSTTVIVKSPEPTGEGKIIDTDNLFVTEERSIQLEVINRG